MSKADTNCLLLSLMHINITTQELLLVRFNVHIEPGSFSITKILDTVHDTEKQLKCLGLNGLKIDRTPWSVC